MTSIKLRADQEKCVKDIEKVFRSGVKSCLLNLATGGGKTYISGSIIKRSQIKNKRCFFICNRIELVDQTIESFKNLGVEAGIIAAGYKHDYSLLTQVCSIDTLKNRLHQIPFLPDLVVHDEARGIAAPGWSRVYDYYRESYHLGLDATPERGDGKPLRPYFQEMVKGANIAELIEIGALVPPRCFTPDKIDLSGIGLNKNGDYDEDELEEYMNKPSITGSAIDHYTKYGDNGQGILFAVNIKHSEALAKDFRKSGINCIHLDANTKKQERREIVSAYKEGEIQLLSNCNLFSAGFDVPNVSYIGDLSPTRSIANFKQRSGRGARPCDDKKYYIYMDHAGNIHQHGILPHDEKEWNLDGKKKKKKKDLSDNEKPVSMRHCPECHCHHHPLPSCPECGYIYPPQDRIVEEFDGELKEITYVEKTKQQKRWELSSAKTMDDLVKIQLENGYKPGWLYHMKRLRGLE
jgi:DNA repair protein RadD